MSEKPENERTCEQCGSPVPPDSPGGMCPKCLAAGVLGNESADDWLNPAPDRSGEVIGGWEILERVGEGAFGEVFHVAAGETESVREGALKILKTGMHSREALARFDAERKALAQLNHPNITRVFDTGETVEGQPWFVMEFVDGEPVTDFCRIRDLPIRRRLEIFETICEAVDHAHDQGIVHRDLKPSNVLVSTDDNGEPAVKLIDFGVAKAMEMPLTQKTLFTHAGVLIGTPEYMSPEQASGKSLDLDARSDVYSLGVLLYELLTGTTPIRPARFREAAFDEILRLVREAEAGRPSSVGNKNKIAADLDWIALKALEKNRDRRYADSGELGGDIRRFLDNEPVRARQPSRLYRAGKFLARNRKAAIGTGIAAALIVIASATSAWLSSGRTPLSPDLEVAQKFHPATVPLGIPNTRSRKPLFEFEGSRNQSNHPETVARLCRQLRDDPSDEHARFRLWGLLAMVGWPERISETVRADADITGASLLDEGSRAAIISEDGRFRSLNLESGEIEFELDCGTPLHCLATTSGGSLAAAGGENGVIHLFDFSGDTPARLEIPAGNSAVRSLAFDGLGTLLISGHEGGEISARTVENGDDSRWSLILDDAVQIIRIHPNNRQIGCCLNDGTIEILEIETGGRIGEAIPGRGAVAGFTFSRIPEELILARSAGGIEIWNFIKTTLELQPDPAAGKIESFGFNSNFFTAGGASGETVVHPMKTPGRTYRTPAAPSPVTALKHGFSKGLRLAAGHADGHWRTWNLNWVKADLDPVLLAEDSPIRHLDISGQPFHLVAAGDRIAKAWSLGHRIPGTRGYREAGWVTDAAFPPDSGLVRFIGENGSILFDVETCTPTGQAMPIPLGASQTTISGDGLWIAAAYGNLVRVWNTPIHGAAKPKGEIALDATVTAIALAPEGRYVAAATLNGGGGVWDSQTGRLKFQMTPDPDASEPRKAALGECLMAAGFQNGAVRIFDWKTGDEVTSEKFGFDAPADALAISPDERSIAAGDRDGNLAMFDPETSRRTDFEFTHENGIVSIAYSHDGKWITTGSRDRFAAWHNGRDGRYLFRRYRWLGEIVIAAMEPEQGHMIVMAPNAPFPSRQPIPPHREPVPDLMLDFAEAFVGFHYDDAEQRHEIPFADYRAVRSKIIALPEDGTATRTWLRWLATDPEKRTSDQPGK